jgi:hypothetical protein
VAAPELRWHSACELVMTQELNRDMLGVRSEGVPGRALATLLTLACSCELSFGRGGKVIRASSGKPTERL